jgi:hypothetical protein
VLRAVAARRFDICRPESGSVDALVTLASSDYSSTAAAVTVPRLAMLELLSAKYRRREAFTSACNLDGVRYGT